MLRYVIAVCVCAFAGHSAMAQNTTPADSLANALATYWGSAVNMQRLSPAQREAFVKGFAENYAPADSLKSQYIRGAVMADNIVRSLREAADMGLTVNADLVGKAVATVLGGGNVGFTQQTAQAYIDAQVDPGHAAEFNPERQKAYLDSAAARPGAVTTPSGLVFEVITEGEGTQPASGQTAIVKYTGRLSDGTVFDQTEQPIDLPVDRLVPGFTEGLKMMKPGGTYRLTIPAVLAYGDRGAGGVIPPGATIDFTVELMGVK